MTINHSMRSKPVLVGIDIAKNRHEVLREFQLCAHPLSTLSMLDFIINGDSGYWSWFDEQDGGSYEQGALGTVEQVYSDELDANSDVGNTDLFAVG